ncbi:MAG: hypothetical protein FWD94_01950 [Treponema sp.]|nr:hypothetical protein [Treponema sp.]
MSDIVLSAMITVGGMVLVVVVTEFLRLRGDERNRGKQFFKDFFPERLKAFQEIRRAVAECGLDDVPKAGTAGTAVVHLLESAADRLKAATLFCNPVIGEAVFEALGDYAEACESAIIEIGQKEGPVAGDATKAVFEGLHRHHAELMGLMWEKSGVDIIDKEFDEVLKGLGKPVSVGEGE